MLPIGAMGKLKEEDAGLGICALTVDEAAALAVAKPMTKFLLLVIDNLVSKINIHCFRVY
jgi:hypothetical protein